MSEIVYVDADGASELAGKIKAKQDALTFDSAPTSGSANPVTSDGVYTALSGKAASSHTHPHTQISDFGTYVWDATINRAANSVLAGPNGKAGAATFRKLVSADLPIATASAIGAVKVGDGLVIASDGTLSVSYADADSTGY